jgi:hypothetical protein
MKKNIVKQSIIGCVIVLFISTSATAMTQQSRTIDNVGRLGIQTYTPTDDSYLNSINEINGNLPVMNLRNGGSGDFWFAQIVIKFDLTNLTSDDLIKSANLNIFYYDYSDANPSGRSYNAYRFEGDWNEETIYADIAPPYSSESSSIAICPNNPGNWITWNVTNDVNGFASGDIANYGWILKDEQYWGGAGIPNAYCRTKEQGTNAPYLEIETYTLNKGILIGKIEQLNTQGALTTFNAVKLRCITFSPFSFNTYTQGEKITVTTDKIGILNTNFAFGLFTIAT